MGIQDYVVMDAADKYLLVRLCFLINNCGKAVGMFFDSHSLVAFWQTQATPTKYRVKA